MRARAAFVGTALLAVPAIASAQGLGFLYGDTTLVRPAIPEGFDRGRNVAVTEKARPDYDALGIPVSSFKLLPRVDVAAGATSNVFLTDSDTKSDGFALIQPNAQLVSDWSRNKLQIYSGANLEEYFSNGRRNQNAWNVGANGEYEIGDAIKIRPEADVARLYESPYSGDVRSSSAVLSNYLTSYLSLTGEYQAGRVRGIASVDRTSFSFSDIDFGDGTIGSQAYRNRKITRFSGQGEYALSPSVSLYAQINYDQINYSTDLFGAPNRDSDGYRITAGINFDLTGFLRGTIGAGYVRRNYDASIYRPVDGPSVEARLEYFPSELTTVTLQLRRFLEDSSIGANNAFFDNRVSLRVDHALLENLLVNVTGAYGHVSYVGLSDKRDNYRVSAGAQYMATRRYGLKGLVSYGHQSSDGAIVGSSFREARGQLGFYVQI